MLTQRCNLRCAYCYQRRSPREQTRDVLEHLARDIRRSGDRRTRVIFHGGEPLLRKDLLLHAVSRLLDEQGEAICDLGIVTNGSRIDDEVLELFCRHGFRVDVSFDGVREAQDFRDRGSFDRVVDNLRKLVACHEAGRLELGVGVTVTLENLPYLARSIDFLTELGVPRLEVEGDLFGPWVEGSEYEVDTQVELVVDSMARRLERGLPIPVSRLRPLPEDGQGGGSWWETDEEREQARVERREAPECNCGASGGSLVHPDGSVWACPMFVPDLGQVRSDRLRSRDAFRYGSWDEAEGPTPEEFRAGGEAIRREPIFGPKGERRSIFGECATCPFVTDCSACPASSHLPDVAKVPEEVPPLLCRLSMAFGAGRQRLHRPVQLLDIVLSVARGRRAARERGEGVGAAPPAH